MKILKDNGNSIILCLFELAAGILLLINPAGFTVGIIIAAGVLMMATGLISCIKYFRMNAAEAARSQLLTIGLAQLVAGGFCALQSSWFLATFPVLTMLYGVVLLFTGFSKIQLAVDMLRLKRGKWYWAAINAAASILCALTVMGNPFTSTNVLWIFTGYSLIVEAVIDVITWIVGREPRGSEEELEVVEEESVSEAEGEIV